MIYIVNLILRFFSRFFDKINNVTVNTFAANLMGIKLLGQRERTNYLLKTPEMSNMVLDAMLKEI